MLINIILRLSFNNADLVPDKDLIDYALPH